MFDPEVEVDALVFVEELQGLQGEREAALELELVGRWKQVDVVALHLMSFLGRREKADAERYNLVLIDDFDGGFEAFVGGVEGERVVFGVDASEFEVD